jgi:hypothetical protein
MEGAPKTPGNEALRKLGVVEAGGRAAKLQTSPAYDSRRIPLWSAHLKSVTEEAIRQLNVEVLSARLVRIYDATDRDMALFELESPNGTIQAMLSRNGEYTFFWKR